MKSGNSNNLINFVLLILISARFFGELITYSWMGSLFALLYFISFLWVFGESFSGYWWNIIIVVFDILSSSLAKDIFWMILVIQILMIGLAIILLIVTDFDYVRRKK